MNIEKYNISSIRILPNDKDTFPTEEEFRYFITNTMIERGGYYYFPNLMMKCADETFVMFQYEGKIRAIGVLIESKKNNVVNEQGVEYAGYYKFAVETLYYLKSPIDKDDMKEIYPEFNNFSQSKQVIPLQYLNNIYLKIEQKGIIKRDVEGRKINLNEINQNKKNPLEIVRESYRFIRPEGASTGQFDSWIIRNDNLAAKETDKSVFEHHESGIPKEVRWYFEAEELSKDERLDVVLVYENIEYRAYIKQSVGRTRIFWYADLSEKFNEFYNVVKTYPILLFEREGMARYKVKFIVGEKKNVIEPLDDKYSNEEKEEHALKMDMYSLEKAARKHSKIKPKETVVSVKQVVRDPYIAEYAKRKANGICQLCGKMAPFNDKKGRPYLESHHIVWLSLGGEDSIENTAALCPNCHKKMHVVADSNDIEILLSKQ